MRLVGSLSAKDGSRDEAVERRVGAEAPIENGSTYNVSAATTSGRLDEDRRKREGRWDFLLQRRRQTVSWTERLRRGCMSRGRCGEQRCPFESAGMKQPVGTSTKGDHHVATTCADDRGHDAGRIGCEEARKSTSSRCAGWLRITGARRISSASKRCGPACSTCASEAWRAAHSRPVSTVCVSSTARRSAAPGGCSGKKRTPRHGRNGCLRRSRAWVRGPWTDALNYRDFSMGYGGRILGVCLCRGGGFDRIRD
jgi:hypothetical protein